MGITVQSSHDTCEPYSNERVVYYLIDKVGLKESEARKIARAIKRKVHNKFKDIITSAEIREEVNAQLRSRGFTNEAREHERVGVPVNELRELIKGHNSDNANLTRNPETVHKFGGDRVFKELALMCLPGDIAKSHNRGNLHIHDLEYLPARPINCLQHDLREFIKGGLKADGSGEHTSVAGPPRQMGTLVNHMGEIMLAGQQNCSGGQGMSLWNVFAAPFAKGLDYDEILQNIQMLVFNLNMAYSNRGGQVPFTSLNTEFTVPKFLEDEPAYGPGGYKIGVYGDFEEETRILNRAFIEVMMEGDYVGKPHLFPNSIWMLRKEMMKNEFEEDLFKVHELSAKYSTPYFGNCLPEWTGGHSNVMGCRTRLNSNWTGDWDIDTLRTGNLAYVTINLPRIEYKTEVGNGFFYEELDRVLGLAEEMLLIRREHALKCLGKNKLLPFLTQKTQDGEQYYRIENATLSFGFVGMDEMLRAMNISDGIVNREGQKIASEVLAHFNKYAKNLTEETGYRWTILQTPGETTAHRFAMLDKQYYPDSAIVKGEKDSYYYTNSSHVPVDNSANLIDRVKIESKFHSLTSGGHIQHFWLGESHPNPEALASLTKKIARTNCGFFAYSSAFSYCFNCNTFLRGLQEQCPKCASVDEIEWYDRITGYVQQVGHKKDSAGGWNSGKQQELRDRYRQEV
jgi:ribonucleoside-triphosphate reductase